LKSSRRLLSFIDHSVNERFVRTENRAMVSTTQRHRSRANRVRRADARVLAANLLAGPIAPAGAIIASALEFWSLTWRPSGLRWLPTCSAVYFKSSSADSTDQMIAVGK
jgi:hypothetical protein